MHWSKTSEAPGLFLFIPIVNLLGKAKGFSFKIYSHLISSPSSSYHWFDPGQHNFLARLMKSFPIRPKNMFYSEKKTNSSQQLLRYIPTSTSISACWCAAAMLPGSWPQPLAVFSSWNAFTCWLTSSPPCCAQQSPQPNSFSQLAPSSPLSISAFFSNSTSSSTYPII